MAGNKGLRRVIPDPCRTPIRHGGQRSAQAVKSSAIPSDYRPSSHRNTVRHLSGILSVMARYAQQLIFILTTSADGGVPVQFRTADGNTSDSITHIDTWETLKKIAGRADFLYVADSKLCSYDNLDHIHRAGGRFVTVLP
ncbi:MAG: hypothetical protein M3Y27_14050, partial [Acidobacteriota bacterium]|nr:hypothetical protein [Acidobacteriota bacterium]